MSEDLEGEPYHPSRKVAVGGILMAAYIIFSIVMVYGLNAAGLWGGTAALAYIGGVMGGFGAFGLAYVIFEVGNSA